jgi:hypothetical protein
LRRHAETYEIALATAMSVYVRVSLADRAAGAAGRDSQRALRTGGTGWVQQDTLQRLYTSGTYRRTKVSRLHHAMLRNLARGRWLGEYEPLAMSCPLIARRVPPSAVSEWAAAAWDCDGLGFSWSCLQAAQQRSQLMVV